MSRCCDVQAGGWWLRISHDFIATYFPGHFNRKGICLVDRDISLVVCDCTDAGFCG
jgi:hypothetical protein